MGVLPALLPPAFLLLPPLCLLEEDAPAASSPTPQSMRVYRRRVAGMLYAPYQRRVGLGLGRHEPKEGVEERAP